MKNTAGSPCLLQRPQALCTDPGAFSASQARRPISLCPGLQRLEGGPWAYDLSCTRLCRCQAVENLERRRPSWTIQGGEREAEEASRAGAQEQPSQDGSATCRGEAASQGAQDAGRGREQTPRASRERAALLTWTSETQGTLDASVTWVVGVIRAAPGHSCKDQGEAEDPRALAGLFQGMGRVCVSCLDPVPPRSASLA